MMTFAETEDDDDKHATIELLSRDLRKAAVTMTPQEARFLVDAYYSMQKQRIVQSNRKFAMEDEPHTVIKWFADQTYTLEKQVKAALDKYSAAQPMGEWMRKIVGVGPVIAAGLLAHIDIKKAPTVGHIWSFAGLNPEATWLGGSAAEKAVRLFSEPKKPADIQRLLQIAAHAPCCAKWLSRLVYRQATGEEPPFRNLGREHSAEDYVKVMLHDVKFTNDHLLMALSKRPWNAELKTLLWKLGESMKRFSTRENCYYGHLYRAKKAEYVGMSETGLYKQKAEDSLKKKNYSKTTEAYKAYKQGKYPPGRLDLMAMRYSTKRFLADMHLVWYWKEFGILPPVPYVFAIAGHSHYEMAPSVADVPDLAEELAKRWPEARRGV